MLQPVPLADIEQLSHIRVQREDQISSLVTIFLPTAIQKVSQFTQIPFKTNVITIYTVKQELFLSLSKAKV